MDCSWNLNGAGEICLRLVTRVRICRSALGKWSIRRKSDVSVFHCQYVAKQLFTDLIGLDIGYCLLFQPFNFYFHTEASDCDKTLETSANSKVASLLAAALGKGDGPSMQHSNYSFFLRKYHHMHVDALAYKLGLGSNFFGYLHTKSYKSLQC